MAEAENTLRVSRVYGVWPLIASGDPQERRRAVITQSHLLLTLCSQVLTCRQAHSLRMTFSFANDVLIIKAH